MNYNRNVLIIEDIVDTVHSLAFLLRRSRKSKTIRFADSDKPSPDNWFCQLIISDLLSMNLFIFIDLKF